MNYLTLFVSLIYSIIGLYLLGISQLFMGIVYLTTAFVFFSIAIGNLE